MKFLLENWRKYLVEEEERKVNIFLDMDGVLVDFPSALKIYIKSKYDDDPDVLHPESKSSRKALRRLQGLQLSNDEIDELYDRSESKFQSGEPYSADEKIMSNYVLQALFKNEDLWLSMKKLAGADEVMAIAFELADNVFILSAHVDPTSKDAKKKWIKHYYPMREFAGVEIDRDKGKRLRELIAAGTVSEDDLNILLDDRRSFLQNFIDAGGTGIQYNFESPGAAIEELKAVIGN
mgnify:CR=1 FL=1|tara:strand:- start:114 stop:821 length:708 start_codon:yes stop_codon:yes gene_type:complete